MTSNQTPSSDMEARLLLAFDLTSTPPAIRRLAISPLRTDGRIALPSLLVMPMFSPSMVTAVTSSFSTRWMNSE